MNALDLMVAAVGVAVAAWVLRIHLWRAVLCVAPGSMRLEWDAPADAVKLPSELEPLAKELTALHFVPLGSHVERPRLERETVSFDFAHPTERAFATLYVGRDGSSRLYFLSRLQHGAFVITANYRRPARELPGRYYSGAIEQANAERLFKAHLRRAATLGQPEASLDPEGRLAAARDWFSGPGRAEVRLQNLHGLLWTVGTLGILAAAIFGKR